MSRANQPADEARSELDLAQLLEEIRSVNDAAEAELWTRANAMIRNAVDSKLRQRGLRDKLETDEFVNRIFMHLTRKLRQGGLQNVHSQLDLYFVVANQARQRINRASKVAGNAH